MTTERRRLPAEWEEQDGALMAWPREGTDWAPRLAAVEPVFAAIAAGITRFEQLVLVAPPPAAWNQLAAAGARMDRVSLWDVPTDDTWARDFGPVTVLVDGRPVPLDFGFNGWGLKFAAGRDNQVTRRLAAAGAFAREPMTVGLVLEGGSIESDGAGTILTTAACLLSANRNPQLDRRGLESALAEHLGAERVLWLESGALVGDDTDSHVDTLARLAPDDTILHVACDDPADEHFEPLSRMAEELAGFRTRDGAPYRLLPLPWPSLVVDSQGERLPATYANFLVVNGGVLMPTYGDPKDRQALAVVAAAFPGREVVGIDCRVLLEQHGSLHCVTMQLPRGVLR